MFSNHVLNLSLVVLPLLLLASCGGNTSRNAEVQPPQAQTVQDKKTELCTNLARFDTAVATLRSMSPSSTVGDIRKAQDQVRTTFNDVKVSSSAVKNAKIEQLERAHQELDKAVKAVPDTATAQQANQSIAPKVSAVQAAENQVKAGVQCP